MSAVSDDNGRGLKLPTKILIGLIIGATIGLSANWLLGPDHQFIQNTNKWVAGPVGQIFLNLLFMIVMPLVFASISLGVFGLGDLRKAGSTAGKTLGFFFATTAVAAVLGIAIVSVMKPADSVSTELQNELMQTYAADATARVQTNQENPIGPQMVTNIVTRNPIRSAADGDMLGVIFFALVFGAALTLIGKKAADGMVQWLTALQEIVIKIVAMAMRLAPYGVAALIFGATSRFGLPLMRSLGFYVITVLVALVLHAVITVPVIVRTLIRMSPLLFYKRIREAIITAFSTSSSAATLPTNLRVSVDNFGVPKTIAGFVLPLGNTMCMNGTALFEGITVIFLAQVFGASLNLLDMTVIVMLCVITAIGAAGVPGGSIPLLVGILTLFHVPGEGIALVLGVDRILDMSRTTLNVIGDHAATLFIARSEGVWSPADIPAVEPAGQGIPLDETPGWPA